MLLQAFTALLIFENFLSMYVFNISHELCVPPRHMAVIKAPLNRSHGQEIGALICLRNIFKFPMANHMHYDSFLPYSAFPTLYPSKAWDFLVMEGRRVTL